MHKWSWNAEVCETGSGWVLSLEYRLFCVLYINRPNHTGVEFKQVSFKKEVGVMVIDLVFWLTVCLILKMCY